MTTTLHPDKLETQKQWDTDPCAAETVRDVERGTLEFYRRIRKHRYEEYGPWFPSVMRFDDFRTKDVGYSCVGPGGLVDAGGRPEYWSGDDALIEVEFDDRTVVRSSWLLRGVEFPPLPLADRVRAWFEDLWP